MSTTPTMPAPDHAGPGTDIAALIAAFPWERTSLGPASAWPAVLRTTIALILRSPVPIVTCWGEDGVMIYNDAYSVFAGGRHPALLGSKVREGWPEVADFNDRMMRHVLAGGTLSYRDQELVLDRNGAPEPVWMDLDYSPIEDETGAIVGIVAIVVETTAKVRAERRALHESDRLHQMFEQAPGFIAMLEGRHHVFSLANRAYRELAGKGALIGRTVAEALPEVAGQGFVELLDRVFESGEAHVGKGIPVRLQTERGLEQRFLDFVYQPIRDPDGRVTGIFVQGQDVTDELRAAAGLAERQEQIAAFVSQSTAGFGQVDLTGRFTLVNDRFCEITGRTREDLLSRTMQSITHPDDLPRNVPLFERAVAKGAPYIHDKRYVRPDGSVVWVNNSVSVIRRADGEPYGVLAVTIDVTERRRAEQAIRESEARLRALTENLRGGMVYQIATDAEGGNRRFLFVSDSFEALTGFPAEAVAKDPLLPYSLILPEDAAALAAAEAKAIAARRPFDAFARFRRADGALRWSRILSAPREQEDGSLIWDGLQIDVTDQKKVEAELRDSKDRLDAALAIARLGTFDWDLATDRVALDARSRELFGFPAEGPIEGRAVFRRIHPDDLPRILAEVEAARDAGARLDTEYRIRLDDGAERIILSLSDAVPGEDGRPARMIGVFADDTERKRLEANLVRLNETLEERVRRRTEELELVHEQLRQSQKLEAIGQLTGGVAHDFNNLLTPIVGGLDMLQRAGIGSARDQRIIAGALESAERARTLVQRLLAFARRQPLRPGPVDLHALVGGMADLIASTSGPRIRVEVGVPADLPPAFADPNQLEMAILNLAVNARDAMPDGGTLTIAATADTVAPGHPARLAPGAYLRLSVSDTGIGMDEDTMARAVEPFFSTKGLGKGTGLGLSMVHGLAEQQGGAMTLSSRPGLGTSVTLWLPAADVAAAPTGRDSRAAFGPPAAAGRILVVDDEELVRLSTADMLRDLGYEVDEAASAAEALSRLAEAEAGLSAEAKGEGGSAEPPRYDYVVTDQLMPGMSGTELAAAVAARHPGIRLLVVSGYAGLDAISPGLPRLAKPFRQPELAAALAALKP
ncbi:PAS domain S-box protein [Sphingosinicella terrae]|uniref:PAS domain S-box protein n=1 Tax=Sphingosinicella terrae TaxID=2172047 RepID=UPI002549BCD1|nr:PAS domain S-box protein [Sphingosinicella terrae]